MVAAVVPSSRKIPKVVTIIALLLFLSLAGGILAQWRASRLAAGTHPMLAPAPTTPSPVGPSKEYIYAGGKLIATEEPAPSTSPTPPPNNSRINFALATNGGVASASSVASSSYAASAANNGDNKGLNWGAGGGWLDSSQNTFPDWLQVDFNSTKTIHQVDVFMVQDSYSAPTDPTQSMTYTLYGLTDFKVQYWNGTVWADIPAASVTGNNLVWKRFSFTGITTSKIRLLCTGSSDGWSRVVELQAWGS